MDLPCLVRSLPPFADSLSFACRLQAQNAVTIDGDGTVRIVFKFWGDDQG